MKLVMTIMVRDEADIITAMIDHHIAQGVDAIIVTDNGSIDGTTQILRDYSQRGFIDLRHDPVQRKQQSSVVTGMARDAYSIHGADWVINADADEFFVPMDRSRTLHQIFEKIPVSYRSFTVPVVNLTGRPAVEGTGFQRLVYRDSRPVDVLELAGMHAHPTANAIHVGDPDIEVVQGNHFVSLESRGSPESAVGLEVLHLPWRSWSQYRNKVEITGRAYESNPDVTPSPNHHGMRDYRRLKANALLPYYFLRHPTEEELVTGQSLGYFTRDDYLAHRLSSPVSDVLFDDETESNLTGFAESFRQDMRRVISRYEERIAQVEGERDEARAAAAGERQAYQSRFAVRAADRLHRVIRPGR